MGNTSEKNLTTHRWFIKKINTDQTISLIPLSLNAMFQIQTSLFKSPNCNEVTLNSKDIIYLNDKEILINETQEKEEILYDEIENSQYPIFRNERFTTNRNDFFTLKAYDYKYLNDFSLFYYSCLFNEVTLDLKDPLIIQFCNHATLLRNDTIHFLKNNCMRLFTVVQWLKNPNAVAQVTSMARVRSSALGASSCSRFSQKKKWVTGSSHCGAVETDLTSIQEDAGSIPGLAKWVCDCGVGRQL